MSLEISKKKILLVAINNRSTVPEYFSNSLLELYTYSKKYLPNIDLRYVAANSVNWMRNLSVKMALENDFDYLIQLDTDHSYPQDFLVKFLQHDKDIVTGCTNQRRFPFFPTQYYKIKSKNMKEQSNLCYYTEEDFLEVIEASGPVGMLIKMDVFKKLTWPYYDIDWTEMNNTVGGDINFCKSLKKVGVEIYCDKSICFPHEISGFTYGKTLDMQGIKIDFDYTKKPKDLKTQESVK